METYGAEEIFQLLHKSTWIKIFGEIPISELTHNEVDVVEWSKKYKIENNEAIILAKFIKSNTRISNIDIRYNFDIGESGSQAIADAIIKSKQINTFSGIDTKYFLDTDTADTKTELDHSDC